MESFFSNYVFFIKKATFPEEFMKIFLRHTYGLLKILRRFASLDDILYSCCHSEHSEESLVSLCSLKPTQGNYI